MRELNLYTQETFNKVFLKIRKNRKILLTVDDGLLSFYKNAWPILKEKKIPFILFVNTREVGSFNYMNWDQIIELYNSENVESEIIATLMNTLLKRVMKQ